jgi:hypothetical protein
MARLQTARAAPLVVRFAGVTVKVRGRGYVATAPYYLKAGGDGRNGWLVVSLGPEWTLAQLRAAVGPKLSAAARVAFERSLDGED